MHFDALEIYVRPLNTKPVINSTDVLVVIAKNTLYESSKDHDSSIFPTVNISKRIFYVKNQYALLRLKAIFSIC